MWDADEKDQLRAFAFAKKDAIGTPSDSKNDLIDHIGAGMGKCDVILDHTRLLPFPGGDFVQERNWLADFAVRAKEVNDFAQGRCASPPPQMEDNLFCPEDRPERWP